MPNKKNWQDETEHCFQFGQDFNLANVLQTLLKESHEMKDYSETAYTV